MVFSLKTGYWALFMIIEFQVKNGLPLSYILVATMEYTIGILLSSCLILNCFGAISMVLLKQL